MNKNDIKTHLDALAELAKQLAGDSGDMASIKINSEGAVILSRGLMEGNCARNTEEGSIALAKAIQG